MNPAAEEIIGIYRRHGPTWTKRRGEVLYEGAWLDPFLALVPPSGTVLDLGCGSGVPIAKSLTDRGYAVTGVDSAPEMIALARARLPGQDWRVADMRTLSLGRTFDGILAWDSFFHLAHDAQRRMFPIFAAHAGPGAALMFTSGPAHGEAMGVMEGEPLYHASLDPAEYRTLLDEHGFDVVRFQAEDPDCGHHTVWLAQKR